MNVQRTLHPSSPGTLTPHRFTVDEFTRIWDDFLHRSVARAELLDGMVYEMPDDGFRTIRWNAALARWLFDSLGNDHVIIPDKTLRLSEHWAPKPDFYIFDAARDEAELTGEDVLLVIEVSDTTLARDLALKLPGYEENGVPEVWVVDVEGRCVRVYRRDESRPGRFAPAVVIAFDEAVSARLIPGLTLKLSDLPRLS